MIGVKIHQTRGLNEPKTRLKCRCSSLFIGRMCRHRPAMPWTLMNSHPWVFNPPKTPFNNQMQRFRAEFGLVFLPVKSNAGYLHQTRSCHGRD